MFSSECWCPLLLCSFASLIHLFCELLHKPAFPCGIYPSRYNLDHGCRPGSYMSTGNSPGNSSLRVRVLYRVMVWVRFWVRVRNMVMA